MNKVAGGKKPTANDTHGSSAIKDDTMTSPRVRSHGPHMLTLVDVADDLDMTVRGAKDWLREHGQMPPSADTVLSSKQIVGWIRLKLRDDIRQIFGAAADTWLNSTSPALDGKSPEEILSDPQGEETDNLQLLIELVSSLKYGSAG